MKENLINLVPNQPDIEIWRPAPKYKGFYEVSNHGHVRSLNRYVTRSDGVRQLQKGKLLKPWKANGYMSVELHKDLISQTYRVHRLVAAAFLLNPENKPAVNHIDGNKVNNHLGNLEWCTSKENIAHAYRTGLKTTKLGDDRKNRILSSPQVVNILHMRGALPSKKIGELYGVSGETVRAIHNNRVWSHLWAK
jgi:hypothetical protein